MFQIDRRSIRYFDWISFGLTILILSIGLLFVLSATYTPDVPFSLFFKKQVAGAISGLVLYFVFANIDIRSLSRWGYGGFFVLLGMLLYTLLMGWVGLGARRWISFYLFRVQPSELAKFLVPFFIGHYAGERYAPPSVPPLRPPLKDFLMPIGCIALCVLLILKQPDLGTALIVLFQALSMFWIIGIDRKIFIAAFLCLGLGAPFLWHMLKPYQQTRILVLLGHGDARNERYQIEQSKIAIGSGGIAGKGFLKGTQNKLAFLPEDHSDFIFAVICEELGFVGACLLLLLFGLLFWRLVVVITSCSNLLVQLVALGHLLHILLSVIINMGMVAGMLPIVGIPLPLISAGNSYLWVCLGSLGIIQNVAMRRWNY